MGISFIMTCRCWFLSVHYAPLRVWSHLFYNSLQADEEPDSLSIIFSSWKKPAPSFHISCGLNSSTCSWVPSLDILRRERKTISKKYFHSTFVVVKESQYNLAFITWRITANNSFLVVCPHFYFLTKLPSGFPLWIWPPSGISVQPKWSPAVPDCFPDDQDRGRKLQRASWYSDSPVSRI